MSSMQRRRVLCGMFGTVGMALGGPWNGVPAFAQAGPARLSEAPLRDGLLRIGGAGGNIVAFGGPSGVAMVDSGSPESREHVSRFIAGRFDNGPIAILFNTHWHLEHTGGNEAAGASGARIIAHENTRLWMSTEFYVDWQDRTYRARPAAALPNETFYSSDPQPIELAYAGRMIEYGHLREAHTDGDIYVRFPEHNVIVAGGALTDGSYPVLDYVTGGLIDGLIDATQRLIDMSDAETLIVPARGPVRRRADLEAQRDMLATVHERIEMLAAEGRSVEEMLEAGLVDAFDSDWRGDPRRFAQNIYTGLWGIYR